MSRSAVGAFAVLTAGVLWGTTGTAASLAPSVPPIAIGAFAMGVGGLLQALIAVRALRTARVGLSRARWLVLLGAGAVVVYPLAFYASMRLAGVAVGTVVSIASTPLFSAILERVVDRVRFTRRWAVAALLAIGGSAVLCFSRAEEGGAGAAATVWGVVLGLAAGLAYAVFSWAVHRVMRSGVPRAAAMGAVFGAGGLALLPVVIATGGPILAGPTTVSVALYLALVPMFLGYVCFGVGLDRIRASTATTLTLCEPAVAAVLAVAVVGESLSFAGWLGLVAVGIGLGVLVMPVPRAGRRSPPSPATAAAGPVHSSRFSPAR
ncbi:DMT family transporter [Agromyces mediolanus]|uniref:Permease n=1 Tax=Agromyces mediolanus TaxID=41986 RepID=A0A918FBC4_AGRME|nr:EamA family transporter [Agromyces mediolanus]GGR27340.1 permease [Agromyces mediolanus]GLJ71911.1 permease [Agromyces mediolanus]